ncbi:MAG: hypothetical protein AABW68_03050 [archaeon]
MANQSTQKSAPPAQSTKQPTERSQRIAEKRRVRENRFRRKVGVGILATLAAALGAVLFLRPTNHEGPRPILGKPPIARIGEMKLEILPSGEMRLGGVSLEEAAKPLVPTTENVKQAIGRGALDASAYPRIGTEFGRRVLEGAGFDTNNPAYAAGRDGYRQINLLATLNESAHPLGVKIMVNIEDLNLKNTNGEQIKEYGLFGVHSGGKIFYVMGDELYSSNLLEFMQARRSALSHIYTQ